MVVPGLGRGAGVWHAHPIILPARSCARPLVGRRAPRPKNRPRADVDPIRNHLPAFSGLALHGRCGPQATASRRPRRKRRPRTTFFRAGRGQPDRRAGLRRRASHGSALRGPARALGSRAPLEQLEPPQSGPDVLPVMNPHAQSHSASRQGMTSGQGVYRPGPNRLHPRNVYFTQPEREGSHPRLRPQDRSG